MMVRYGFAAALLSFVPGCGDGASGGGAPDPTIEDAVTDRAAVALSDGRLLIEIPPLRYGSLPSIDSSVATQYAKMYLAQFWEAEPSGLKEAWETSHGSSLELTTLAPCGPVRLGRSAVVADVNLLPAGSRRLTAEYWLIHFCVDSGETAGFIGVSPYSTDIQVIAGELTWPPLQGAQFQFDGLPPIFEEAVLYSPESAAILAFKCTGRKVRTVPRLILQYGQRGFTGKWELVLEARSSVRVGNKWVSTDTLYAGYTFIGRGGAFHLGVVVRSAEQPSTIPLTIIDNIPPDSVPVPPDWAPHFREVTLDRDPSIPVAFDSVSCSLH